MQATYLKTIFACLVLAMLTACGGGDSTSTTVVKPTNVAPVAKAGAAQNVVLGATVTLDGSGSDANGDTLTYSWTLTAPAGSTAKPSSGTSPKPTLTPDVAGSYVATLIVNDGKLNSAASSVSVTVTGNLANAAPVANAGSNQNVVAGTWVMLDGSASSDANGDALFLSWAWISKPAGSTATLSSTASDRPGFMADVAGTYLLSLLVSDGKINSNPATVMVSASAGNAAPVANAGAAQNVGVGAQVALDGSKSSDANGDSLSYNWTLTSKPAGSTAVLSSATSVKPTFVADVAGTYVASLIVNDGKLGSSASTVAVSTVVPGTVVPGILIDQKEPASGVVKLSLSDAASYVKVSWYLDLALMSDTTWDTTTVANGSHLITAQAQMSNGSSVQLQRAVLIRNLSKTFFISVNADITRVPGTLSVYVTATDGSGVPKAEAFINGSSLGELSVYNYCSLQTVWCTSQSGPVYDMYLFTKAPAPLKSGTYVISLLVTARTGETKTDTFSLIVNNPPLLTLTAPTDGATVSGNLRVTGSASSDKSSAVNVTAKLGDYPFMSTGNANFDGSMSLVGLAAGSYTLTVTATDATNAVTAITRTVKVTN